LSEERWKDVRGFEGIYFVSNKGNVKKLVNGKEVFIEKSKTNTGYYNITLQANGKKQVISLNRLVALHFLLQPNDLDKCVVAVNLYWKKRYKIIPGIFQDVKDIYDEDVVNYFWSNVVKTNRCWLWKLEPTLHGKWGCFTIKGKMYEVRRYSYFLHGGEDYKERFNIYNSCDNILCVNPAHLYTLRKTKQELIDILQEKKQNGILERPWKNDIVVDMIIDYLNGNHSKINEFITKNQRVFFGAIKYRIRKLNREEVQDAFQLACIDILKAIDRGTIWRINDIYAYFIKICHNRAIEVVKERRPNVSFRDDIELERYSNYVNRPKVLWEAWG